MRLKSGCIVVKVDSERGTDGVNWGNHLIGWCSEVGGACAAHSEVAGSEAAAATMALSFTQEYFQIPVVTRAYTTACVLTTAAVVRNYKLRRSEGSKHSLTPDIQAETGNVFIRVTITITVRNYMSYYKLNYSLAEVHKLKI